MINKVALVRRFSFMGSRIDKWSVHTGVPQGTNVLHVGTGVDRYEIRKLGDAIAASSKIVALRDPPSSQRVRKMPDLDTRA